MIGLSDTEKMAVLSNAVGLDWHEQFIESIAAIVKPKVYVELGLYKCTLFNRIIPYAQQLIGLDINPNSRTYMQKSSKTRFIYADTKAFAQYLTNNPIEIDMLFIDADHSKQAVEEDFLAYFPFVVPHGLILLHDSYPKDLEQTNPGYCGDGYLAIEKLSHRTDDYEMMTIPVPPGLTLCRKRKSQLAWQNNERVSECSC